jgi:TPR repeat protein
MKRLLTTLVILTGLIGSGGAVWAQDYDKGLKAAQSGDFVTALKEWKPLAEQGDARAQYNLGLMYAKGMGATQDYAEAVKWYRKAVEQGHASAQYNLGVMYRDGEGVTQDYAEAVKWFRKAADQEHAKAQYNLGAMYRDGNGVTQQPVDEVSFLGRLVSGREYCGYGEYPAQTSLWREHGDQIGSLGRQEYENGAIPRRHGLFRGSSTDDLTHQ